MQICKKYLNLFKSLFILLNMDEVGVIFEIPAGINRREISDFVDKLEKDNFKVESSRILGLGFNYDIYNLDDKPVRGACGTFNYVSKQASLISCFDDKLKEFLEKYKFK